MRGVPIPVAALHAGLLGVAVFLAGCCVSRQVVVREGWEAEGQPDLPKTVEVIGFNAHLTPVASKQRVYRAQQLTERIYDKDIIGLSEVFGGGAGQDKVKQVVLDDLADAGFYVATEPTGGKRPRLLDSGLILGSRFPISEYLFLPYECCFQFDCFSLKAALLATLEIDEHRRLQVLLTHLQAKEFTGARMSQVAQIRELLAEHVDPKMPLLILGDFNIEGGLRKRAKVRSQYNVLLHALGDPQDVFLELDKAYPTSNKSRIDFVFCRSCERLWRPHDDSRVTEITYVAKSQKERPFSDHKALIAVFSSGEGSYDH